MKDLDKNNKNQLNQHQRIMSIILMFFKKLDKPVAKQTMNIYYIFFQFQQLCKLQQFPANKVHLKKHPAKHQHSVQPRSKTKPKNPPTFCVFSCFWFSSGGFQTNPPQKKSTKTPGGKQPNNPTFKQPVEQKTKKHTTHHRHRPLDPRLIAGL